MVILCENVPVGKEGELCIRSGYGSAAVSPPGAAAQKRGLREPPPRPKAEVPLRGNLRLPAILIRCELCLKTRDGRVIRHYADPGVEDYSRFPVRERGAYYGEHDRFLVFDAPGLFFLSLPIQQSAGDRLLALPRPAGETIPLSLNFGGNERRIEPRYRKSDELTDHRPYIPGDDPRRINWKLYGHAPMGELFVREGEPRPPPNSRLLILLDTEADLSLYTVDEGRRAVDLLCENALTAALEFSSQGMDILIGYTGGGIIGENAASPLNAADLAPALARPAAVFRPAGALSDFRRAGVLCDFPGEYLLPQVPQDRSVLILALPRAGAPAQLRRGAIPETSALDRFIKSREAEQETSIFFLYDADSRRAADLEDAAQACVNFYNGRRGIHAGKAKAAILPGGTQ